MEIVYSLFISIMVLLFPLMVNLFYLAYIDNLDTAKKGDSLDFSLLSSIYIVYFHLTMVQHYNLLILANIPLIIAFIKKRDFISIVMSILIVFVCYYNPEYDSPLIVIITQFLIYYLLYLKIIKKDNNPKLFLILFLSIKFIFSMINYIFFEGYSFWENIINTLVLIVFIIIVYLVVYAFKMCEVIMNMHLTIKALENDKKIHDSLFKITHEIKNPLAVCKTYLDMFDLNDKEHLKFVPIIKEEIEKTLILLQDFLCMNKIKITLELMDINVLLEDIISQFQPIMKTNNIVFEHEIIDDDIYINGDYNRLSQVFINIIKNSIEAKDDNKKSIIRIKAQIKNKKIKLIIWDNGTGINEDVMLKIREPFYTTKKNGTGLGVPLSCEIIDAHGGKIEYTSEYSNFTQVDITLPITEIE